MAMVRMYGACLFAIVVMMMMLAAMTQVVTRLVMYVGAFADGLRGGAAVESNASKRDVIGLLGGVARGGSQRQGERLDAIGGRRAACAAVGRGRKHGAGREVRDTPGRGSDVHRAATREGIRRVIDAIDRAYVGVVGDQRDGKGSGRGLCIRRSTEKHQGCAEGKGEMATGPKGKTVIHNYCFLTSHQTWNRFQGLSPKCSGLAI